MKIEIPLSGPVVSLDDDETYQFLLSCCFKRSSIDNPLILLNSLDAFYAWLDGKRKEKAGVPPTLVLLDVNLGTVNGLAEIPRIRRYLQSSEAVDISVLTSSDNPAEQQKCQSLGVRQYLTKPLSLEDYEFHPLGDWCASAGDHGGEATCSAKTP